MCGIFGIVGGAHYDSEQVRLEALLTLSPRGPDADGVFVDHHQALMFAHTQLAITDISDRSRQPFVDPQTSSRLVFNGEIYNFEELKKRVESSGWIFKSTSDTEVLFAGLILEGANFLHRCSGMFSVAFFDGRENTLMLARDRLGEKPLYFFNPVGGGIVFSSDSKLIANLFGLGVVDKECLDSYFNIGYGSTDSSFFRGICKIKPGTYSVFEADGKLRACHTYWQLQGKFRQNIDEAEALDRFEELMNKICHDQSKMFDTVKGGVFLSGGIDSTIIAHFLQSQGRPLIAMTASFDSKNFDEAQRAKSFSASKSLQHEILDISNPSLDEIIQIFEKFDEPIADTSAIPTYLLSKFAKEHVKFALSGDGGDEIFGGYTTYLASRLARSPWSLLLRPALKTITPFLKTSAEQKISFAEKILRLSHGMTYPYPTSHVSWRHIFTPDDFSELIDDPRKLHTFYERQAGLFREEPGLQSEQLFDIGTYLVENILVKSDRMSMANGLEIRSPFLDHRIVEFGVALPNHLKVKGWHTKYLLKRFLERKTGLNFLGQKKQGFSAPIGLWINNVSRRTMEYLCDSNLWRIEYVHRLLREHLAGARNHTYRLTALISYTAWAQSLKSRIIH